MTPLRRRVAAVALLLLVPALSACGFHAQTDSVYQPAVGANDRDGTIDILNALIVSDKSGQGVFAGTFVNNDQTRADQLSAITVDGSAGDTSPIAVPAGGAVPAAGLKSQITIKGADVEAGNFVTVNFTFKNGQETQMRIPVVAATGDYADVIVTPAPKPAAPASPTASPTA